jgi:ketosteroid isomerase-like protein
MQAIQNHGAAMSIDSLLQFSRAFRNVVENFRYEDAIRSATEHGFVEEHSVRGTLPDGSELRLAACVVADVDNGRITQLREYFDGAAVAGLRKMLAQS